MNFTSNRFINVKSLINSLRLVFVLIPFFSTSQIMSTDYGNYLPCSGPIELYVFDFTATGSNAITQAGINIQNSDNQCCGLPTNNGCLFFDVYIDPGATGVSFSQTGAGGSIIIYYENCDSTFGANEDICLESSLEYIDSLTGLPYHRFMFCRTGQTTYDFTFTQITPIFPDDIGVTEGCTIDLVVQDLDPNSIVWTSIAPGTVGDWDFLLDCPTGCLDVVVTPIPGASPPSITYTVCGTLPGACNLQTFCDTVTVTIYPDLFADAGPDVAFCDGSFVPITSTGTAIGGAPPYTYDWTGFAGIGTGFNFNTVSPSSTQDVDFNQPGSYELIITDVNGCAIAIDTVEVYTFVTSIESFINTAPLSICFDPTPTISLEGYVIETFTGEWTSSNGGTFSSIGIDGTATAPANTPQTVAWTPTPGTTGIVTLTLTPTNNAECPTIPATIDIDLTQFTSTLALTPTLVSCNGGSDGGIDLSVTLGAPPYGTASYTWSTLNGFGLVINDEDQSALTIGTYQVVVSDVNGCVDSVSTLIAEPQALVVTITGDSLLCNGDADGNVFGTISGGTAPYIITLVETGATLNIANDTDPYDFTGLSSSLQPGGSDTYSVTVTDANGNGGGCTLTVGPVNMFEPQALQTSLSPSVYVGGWNVTGCTNDGSIDLTVTGGVGGYIFDWDNDGVGDFDDLEDINSLFPGWYQIVIFDNNNCVISDSIFMTAPAVLNVSTTVTTNYNGEDVSCQGASDGGVNAVALDGTPGYTYQWEDSLGNILSTNPNVNGLSAGWYFVTVTDQNSCTSFDSIQVADAPQLISTIAVSSNYNGQDISCFGSSDGSIDFNVIGGTPGYVYEWSDSLGNIIGNTEDLTGLTAGTYDIHLLDLNGCIVDTSITLTNPPELTSLTAVISDYNGEDISCFQLSDGIIEVIANGGTPGLSYEWVDSFGNVISNNSLVNGVPEGTYTVTVTDVNGCAVIKDIYVSQPPALTLSIDILTNYFGLPISCEFQLDGEIGTTVSGGTPGYTYLWDTNPTQTTPIITDLGVGTYTVVVTDINGCTITDSVILDANPIPILNPDASVEACQGETVTFNANSGPNESCEWVFSNGIVLNDCGPNTLFISGVGCYDALLIITNQFGCQDSASMADYICIRPNPIASFTANPTILSVLDTDVDFTNESTGATDYIWSFGDGGSATSTDAYHQYPFDQTGYYDALLIAISEYGCTDTASVLLHVKDALLFYVPNTFTPDGDQYNNSFKPVIGSGVSPENYEFAIFNRWGELIFITNDLNESWDGTYKGKRCQDGTYAWRLFVTASENVIESGQRSEYVGHVNIIR